MFTFTTAILGSLALERGQTKLASLIEIERGKQAQRAAMFDALGSFAGGFQKYKMYGF